MINQKMFKTAFSGFDKNEVMNYLKSQNEQRETDIAVLNNRISELENTVASQSGIIKSKNQEIESLLDKLEVIQKQDVGRLSQMTKLVDELTIKEMKLNRELDKSQKEYKSEITGLKSELSKTKENYESELTRIKKEAKESLETQKNELEQQLIIEVGQLKKAIKSEQERNRLQVEELRKAHINEINRLNDSHKKELKQTEEYGRQAAQNAILKEAHDASKDIEMEARFNADKILCEARMQCDEMRHRTAVELAERREHILSSAEKELKERMKEIEATSKKLREIMDAVESNRNKFSIECERIKESLKRFM